MGSMGTEPEGDDILLWQDEYAYDLAGNRTQKAHTESLGNGDLEFTLRHYKYNQANQLILEWKEEGTLTTGTVAGEVWDEESGLAKLTLNGVTPSIWGDYFYGEAPPSNGTVFLLAEDHVKNQTLIAVNVSTGLSDFVGYSYDENGNLVERLSEEGPTVYEWDHRNRLTKVIHPDGSETAYEYCAACPLGKLAKMTRKDGSTVEWAWDGISFLREVDSDDALPTEYFGSLSVKREGAWYYLHMDVMGTVWQVTDETGAVVNDFQWDAWGNELSGTFTDGNALSQIGWQGKRWDQEQGVFYSVARWYDQRLGRFTQVDPVEGLGIVSTGGEGYAWPWRDGVSVSDPTGLVGPGYFPSPNEWRQLNKPSPLPKADFWVCHREWMDAPRGWEGLQPVFDLVVPSHAFFYFGRNPLSGKRHAHNTWSWTGADTKREVKECYPCRKTTRGKMDPSGKGEGDCKDCSEVTNHEIFECLQSVPQKEGFFCRNYAGLAASRCCLKCSPWEMYYP